MSEGTRRSGLLDDEALEASTVVANSTMNRQRGLRGVNSYAKELGFDPLDRLLSHFPPSGDDGVAWLDLCCGEGQALVQGAQEVAEARLAGSIAIVGVDLVDAFTAPERVVPGLDLVCASLHDWRPERQFDLITCVHGLHYIGDKLGVLARMAGWLTPDGELVADFELASVRIDGGRPAGRSLATALRQAGFDYDARRHQIRLRGRRSVELAFEYAGSDPAAGPNYTGQPAVHSHYRFDPPDSEAL